MFKESVLKLPMLILADVMVFYVILKVLLMSTFSGFPKLHTCL